MLKLLMFYLQYIRYYIWTCFSHIMPYL